MKHRKLSYDLIRIVALAMIVMVHVSAYLVIFFPDVHRIEWSLGNLFNGLARAGVPMFVMLSGALLLREDKTLAPRQFYRSRLLRMALLAAGWLLFYGLVYGLLLPALQGDSPSLQAVGGFLLRFQGSEYPHLWYLFMVLGMYLMIPVLRLFVRRENRSYVLGMILGCVLLQFAARTADLLTLECSTTVSGFLGKFHLQPLTGFLGYLLLGWYLSNYRLSARSRGLLYAAGLVCLVGSTLVVYGCIGQIPQIRDYMYSELSLPAMVYGCALFVLLQQLAGERMTRSRHLAGLSDACFGIYLVHVLLLELFVRFLLPYEQYGPGRPLSYMLLLYAFCLLLSYAIVRLAGRLGPVRHGFYPR